MTRGKRTTGILLAGATALALTLGLAPPGADARPAADTAPRLVAAPSASGSTAGSDDTPTSGASTTARALIDLDPTDRASMVTGWKEVLKPALATPIGWTGDIDGCDAGAPSAAGQEATLTAVNYFRELVGVRPVTFDATLSSKAQQAALIMAANADLSHTPQPDWTCWSTDGSSAAGKSNLYLGRTGADAVAGYMVDPGSGNTSVGHRRWIIYPNQTRMGSGSVEDTSRDLWSDTAHALYVIDSGTFQAPATGTPAYVPWPVAGYHPLQIEPGGRWSLSATDPTTDFRDATVTIDGSAAGITRHEPTPAPPSFMGSPTLVWNFDPGFEPGDADRAYDVEVSGIKVGGATTSHSYTVTLIDAEPPLAPQTISFTPPASPTYGDAPLTLSATASSGLPVTFTTQSPGICTTGGVRGATLSLVGAGVCTVRATQAGSDAYAPAPPVSRNVTVQKKALVVAPDPASRPAGEPNPAVAVSFGGFVTGEDLATSGVTGAPLCSSTATASSPPGDYPVTCTRGTLAAANYSFGFVPGVLTVTTADPGGDTTPPDVAGLGAPFRIALGVTTARFGADDASGIARWQLQTSSRTRSTLYSAWAAGSWSSVSSAPLGNQPDGSTTCVQARAEDTVGNVSSWSASTCAHRPIDDTAAVPSTGSLAWTRTSDSRLWKGSARTTTRRGASLRVGGLAEVDTVGIVVTTCPGCGRVAIDVGTTRVATLDLDRAATRRRVVLQAPALPDPASGPLRVTVLSSGARVQIDGLVASDRP